MAVTAARQKLARQEALLRRLLRSSAFSLAEQLSRLRQRAGVAREDGGVSKADVEQVLES